MLRYLTAGESHGRALVGILEGMPAGLEIDEETINLQLGRRQCGYGRGGRMKIESDRAQILSGVRFGRTLGSPVALMVENCDWENWRERMAVTPDGKADPVLIPRPGHADLAGMIKYGFGDIRNVLERSSARETAMRVAVCTLARKFLQTFGITIGSHVTAIGEARVPGFADPFDPGSNQAADRSPVRCLDPKTEQAMRAEIDGAKAAGDSLGGIFEVVVTGLPVGLGSYVHWDRRLDGQLAEALMSIQAIKGVEIGLGFESAARRGSTVHDEILPADPGTQAYARRTNNAGGLEGGMTNGEPLVLRAAMKPIPTLTKPLQSVHVGTQEPIAAHHERSDVCAVPAASVVGEAVVAFTLANAFLEKFGGDSVAACGRNLADAVKRET
ncbi:MAG: chorismate synthase [Candidatus Latescibacterota bacterium]